MARSIASAEARRGSASLRADVRTRAPTSRSRAQMAHTLRFPPHSHPTAAASDRRDLAQCGPPKLYTHVVGTPFKYSFKMYICIWIYIYTCMHNVNRFCSNQINSILCRAPCVASRAVPCSVLRCPSPASAPPLGSLRQHQPSASPAPPRPVRKNQPSRPRDE